MLNRLILSLKSIHNSALIPHVIIVIILTAVRSLLSPPNFVKREVAFHSVSGNKG